MSIDLTRPIHHALCAAALALQTRPRRRCAGRAAAAAKATPTAQRWDLRDLYATPADWDAAFAETRRRVDTLPALRDSFGSSAAQMLQALVTISDAAEDGGPPVRLRRACSPTKTCAMPRRRSGASRCRDWPRTADEKTSWVALTLQSLGAERVRGYLAAEPALKARFDMLIEDALRNAPHTLGAESEALLAANGIVLAQPRNIFDQLAEAELPRPRVTLRGGRKVTLTQDAYEVERRSPVREDRKRVFDAFFGGWKAFEGTFGANLAAQVQGDVFSARARKFGGSLDAALFGSNMPPAVYRTLVEQARAGLPTLHRYLALRKKMLGIQGPLAYYDNYPPLLPGARGERYDIERSKAVTLQALAPLGDEYLGLLKQGFAGTWMDSHPRTGKASGAYMAGYAYDVHPYLLLNHSDDFQGLSTLAHEWGHAVHTMLAKAQPAVREGRLLDLHRRVGVDRQRDAAVRPPRRAGQDAGREDGLPRPRRWNRSAPPSSARRCSPSSSWRCTKRSSRAGRCRASGCPSCTAASPRPTTARRRA